MGVMTILGLGTAPDANKGVQLMVRAIRGGVHDAAVELGDLLWEGKVVEQDRAEAVRLWQLAASFRNSAAIERLERNSIR